MLPFNARIGNPAPKADFQYWSTTWATGNIVYPTPIFILPEDYHHRKFWWGVRFATLAQRNTDGISFEWSFQGTYKGGSSFSRNFKAEYLTSSIGPGSCLLEGMQYNWPFPNTVTGLENQIEPMNFRDKLGGTAHVFGSCPNFFMGQFNRLVLRPIKALNGWMGPFIGSGSVSVFAAVYSEQSIEPK